ncbi:hypothetical protein N2152v2_000341 [Parachlorella kessleri]
MAKKGSAAAGGCASLAVVLSLAAALVMTVGLAGLQSACTDLEDGYTAASSEPYPGIDGAGSAGSMPAGSEELGDVSQVVDDTPDADPPAPDGQVLPNTTTIALEDLPGLIQNVTDLAKNITQTTVNQTQEKLNTLLAKFAHSHGFVTCARIYSLPWWALVCQLVLFLACSISLCSSSCMRAAGHPLLLFTSTVVVLDMLICNTLVQATTYDTSPEGSDSHMSSWRSVTLAGFILACVANYLYLFSAPSLLKAREKAHAGGREERRPLAISVEELTTHLVQQRDIVYWSRQGPLLGYTSGRPVIGGAHYARVVIRQGDEHFSGEHLTRRTHDYHSEVEHGVPFGRGALREDPFGSDRPRSAPRRQQYSQQGQYRQQLQQQRQHLHSSGGRGRQAQRNEPPRVLAFGEGALTKWH